MTEEQVVQKDDTNVATVETTTKNDKIVFGFSSINLKTPESARQFFKLYLLVVTIIVVTVNGFKEIPLETKNLVFELTTVLTLIGNKLEDFFGVADSFKS